MREMKKYNASTFHNRLGETKKSQPFHSHYFKVFSLLLLRQQLLNFTLLKLSKEKEMHSPNYELLNSGQQMDDKRISCQDDEENWNEDDWLDDEDWSEEEWNDEEWEEDLDWIPDDWQEENEEDEDEDEDEWEEDDDLDIDEEDDVWN